jgi:hypothetical protein
VSGRGGEGLKVYCVVMGEVLAGMFFEPFHLTAQLKKDVSEAREAVKLLRAENVELKAIIDTGYKRIVLLENQAKGFEQKYNHDVKERDSRISYLTKELNTKSDTIAYLTTQLHQIKLKEASRKHDQASSRGSQRHQKRVESSSVGEATASSNTTNSEAVPPTCAPPTPPITPSPPSQGAPTRVRRPFRRSATSPTPVEINIQKSKSQRAIGIQASPHELHLNVSSPKTNKGLPSRPKRGASPPRPGIGIAKNPSRSGGRERPPADEYVEFLRSGVRPEPQVVVRAAPEPLPPILANDMHLKRTPSYHGMSRGSSKKVQDDLGKIVVSPLGSPEKGWRHKEQPPQSHGSKM